MLRRARLAGSLAVLQWMTQGLGLVSGFFLLRWLSVRDYAEYTFAFAFASMVSQLVDLGFLDSLIGLIGDRADDPNVIGSYMRAAMSLRGITCGIVLPVSAVPFILIASAHGWSYGLMAALFGSVIITLLTRAAADYYSVPVLLARRYGAIYAVQAPVAGLRLLCTAALHFGRLLTGWVAALVNAGALAVTGVAMKRMAAPLVQIPRTVDPRHRTEIVRVIAPLVPNQLFAALQGQVTVLIISVAGSTSGLAQVGALSRLAQLFVIVAVFNAYVIAPVIARTTPEALAARVAKLLGAVAAILGVGTLGAFIWPEPMLWFLGSHYHGLADPARWYVLAGSLTAIGGTAYTMSIARRFVWWWGSLSQIALALVAEVVAGFLLNLHRVLDLQYFAVIVATTLLVTQLTVLVYGVRRGPRELGV